MAPSPTKTDQPPKALPHSLVRLLPGHTFNKGDRITITQSTDSDASDLLPAEQGVEVLATPRKEDLNGLFASSSAPRARLLIRQQSQIVLKIILK